jgi:hypothetical protein
MFVHLDSRVGQRHAELVHAFGAVRRKTRVVLADPPRIAQHLRKIEVPAPVALLVRAQDHGCLGTRRVPPDRVGRHDGVARPLVDRIGQRKRHAERRRLDAVRLADVVEAFVVVAERNPPLGLDRARRSLGDHIGNSLALARGDLRERVLERHGGSRVAVAVERHVGQAAMRCDRLRPSCRALERRSTPKVDAVIVLRQIAAERGRNCMTLRAGLRNPSQSLATVG